MSDSHVHVRNRASRLESAGGVRCGRTNGCSHVCVDLTSSSRFPDLTLEVSTSHLPTLALPQFSALDAEERKKQRIVLLPCTFYITFIVSHLGNYEGLEEQWCHATARHPEDLRIGASWEKISFTNSIK